MDKVKFALPFGIKVKNIINGLEGVITSRIERINGCLQYHVQVSDADKSDKSYYCDAEDLEVLDKKMPKDKAAEFKYKTGDRLKNRINNKTGIVTVRRQDKNGCVGYFYETGEQHPENGSLLEFYGFEQEFSFVDDGLNAKDEEPIERKRTGCMNITSSGKY